MLKIESSIGSHILQACTNAVLLARHPLTTSAVPNAWYAFVPGRGDRLELELGPWFKPDDAAEDYPGQLFWNHCHEIGRRGVIRAFADGSGPGVSFDFNGETVICEALSHDDPRPVSEVAEELQTQWSAKMEAARVAYWTPERKAEEQRRQDEYAAKMQVRRETITTAVTAHPFEPTDPEAYAEYKRVNSDGYGGGVVKYGEAWAALMDAALASDPDVTIAEIAERTQYEADCEGITGFMFGCAVQQLTTWWKHGEALRVWHNAKHGVPADVSGVVNPAVLTIGPCA